MKKLLIGTALATSVAASAFAGGHGKEVTIGVFLGFTGPIESMVAEMGPGAEFAISEVNESGALLDSAKVTAIRADTTCIDSGAAQAAIERLITADGVDGVVGGDCSGVTGAALMNVALPNGMVMVSPSATSPGLSHNNNEDKGLFFRTAPSDARQGVVMTEVLMDQGIKSVAVTYTNNDYGKGLADAFQSAYEAAGGTITINAPHEEGKADYSSEVGVLASAGGDALLVIGYIDDGGKGMIEASLDSGAFDTFVLSDGMIGQSIVDNIGADLEGSFGSMPGAISKGSAKFGEIAAANGMDGSAPYVGESYDAAAIIALAIQAGGSADKQSILNNIAKVSNAPGIVINPGQLSYGLQMLAAGKDIDYQGATDVEFNAFGDAAGAFKELEVSGGEFVTVGAL